MYVSEETGLITAIGPVNDDMHAFMVEALVKVNSSKRKSVKLILSTEGGDTHAGFALYDLIRTNPKPVQIIVNGRCESAGTLVLQAGVDRLATPHAQFLIHWGQQGGSSHSEFEFDRRMHEKWVELMAARTEGRTRLHDMELIHRGETWLTAHDALVHGLVDAITDKVL